MSKLISILACSASVSIFSYEAQAFPGAPTQVPMASPWVIPARGFCGLGRHRSPNGYCVPNSVPYGYAPPPVVVAPGMTCPYPYHYDAGYGGCLR